MRQATKLAAAMLVITSATTMVPQKADASLFGIITGLLFEGSDGSETIVPLEPPPQAPVAFTIFNTDIYRDHVLAIQSSDGDFRKVYVGPNSHRFGPSGDVFQVHGDSDWYAITMYAIKWVDGKPKVVTNPKDYVIVGPGARVSFYKEGRGNWQMQTMYLR